MNERIRDIEINALPIYEKPVSLVGYEISNLDYDWLVNQAKCVKELEEENSKLKQQADFWRTDDREMMRLSEENRRYKDALVKIARRKMSMYLTKDDMFNDFIKIANDALEDVSLEDRKRRIIEEFKQRKEENKGAKLKSISDFNIDINKEAVKWWKNNK